MSDGASDGAIQVFISYARVDNEPPPEMRTAPGFVTFLHDQLRYELRARGEPRPRLWLDVTGIGRHEEFPQPLQQAIDASHILLVVLSGNWLESPNCRKELDAFAERWKDSKGVRERIFIVRKREVNLEDYPDLSNPELLKDREGFKFYDLEDPERIGLEKEYFWRGKIDERYMDLIHDLGGHLWRAAKRVRREEPQVLPLPKPARLNGRTIYVAKPATDMLADYDRVVRELVTRGYAVVPEPGVDIPSRDRAVAFVDENLAHAEASIHLLGVSHGYVPENADPIVNLQLKRAGSKLGSSSNHNGKSVSGFRRFVWAPESLGANSASNGGRSSRNPLTVLEEFDRFHHGDEIVGGILTRFVDIVLRDLEQLGRGARAKSQTDDSPTLLDGVAGRLGRPAPHGANGSSNKANSRVYIYHHDKDRRFARKVVRALTEGKVGHLKLPPLEGEPAQRNWLHRQYLAECDKVIICWALATDSWALAAAYELKDWRDCGRDRDFELRGLVVGPPPRGSKTDFVLLQQPDEIDIVVNKMKNKSLSADELAKAFASRSHEP
jgi:hypothetical protein